MLCRAVLRGLMKGKITRMPILSQRAMIPLISVAALGALSATSFSPTKKIGDKQLLEMAVQVTDFEKLVVEEELQTHRFWPFADKVLAHRALAGLAPGPEPHQIHRPGCARLVSLLSWRSPASVSVPCIFLLEKKNWNKDARFGSSGRFHTLLAHSTSIPACFYPFSSPPGSAFIDFCENRVFRGVSRPHTAPLTYNLLTIFVGIPLRS